MRGIFAISNQRTGTYTRIKGFEHQAPDTYPSEIFSIVFQASVRRKTMSATRTAIVTEGANANLKLAFDEKAHKQVN